MVFINLLLYIFYNKIFYKTGVNKVLFMNSTFVGTTTGFTFPFVAIYYNIKNAAIIYSLIIILFIVFLNSNKFVWAATNHNNKADSSSYNKTMESAVTVVKPEKMVLETLVDDDGDHNVSGVERQKEPEELLGEYFDPSYMQYQMEEDGQSLDNRKFEIQDVSKCMDRALDYKKNGNYLAALENFILVLKLSSDINTGFKSCLYIASIYKEMDQYGQAKNILYYYLNQYRNKIDKSLMEEAVEILYN